MSTGTHTIALLEVSPATYDEIRAKLTEAGYAFAFVDGGGIDMHGIGLVRMTDQHCASCRRRMTECKPLADGRRPFVCFNTTCSDLTVVVLDA